MTIDQGEIPAQPTELEIRLKKCQDAINEIAHSGNDFDHTMEEGAEYLWEAEQFVISAYSIFSYDQRNMGVHTGIRLKYRDPAGFTRMDGLTFHTMYQKTTPYFFSHNDDTTKPWQPKVEAKSEEGLEMFEALIDFVQSNIARQASESTTSTEA